MCIAGLWVLALGVIGYEMLKKYGGSYDTVATLAHYKSYPDMPCFNYMKTDQAAGMAYFELMSGIEQGTETLELTKEK